VLVVLPVLFFSRTKNQNMGDKSPLLPYDEQPHGLCQDGIDEYATRHSTWSKKAQAHQQEEPTILDAAFTLLDSLESELLGSNLDLPVMCVGKQEGQILSSIACMARPRNILEVGTFTGYSAIALATALPGEKVASSAEPLPALVTVDNWSDVPQARALAEKYIGKFNALCGRDCIAMHNGTGISYLAEAARSESCRSFDVVFLDADKDGQVGYYEELVRERPVPGGETGEVWTLLSRPHGIIIVDNTLWYGKMAQTPQEEWDETTRATHDFNTFVLGQTRTRVTMLTCRDGLSLIQWA
jgi:predicted O-methyltransferase YrrM